MKRKLFVIAITVILLLTVPVTLLIWGFALPVQYGETFLGELKYKVRLLEEAPSPRIILVGGSGVAFGTDSALMKRELPGYSVVNFGMYAALGTTVMLDLSQPYVREGDIVVLIPEQQEQALSGWFDPAVLWQGLDGDFGLLHTLPRDKLDRLAGAFPTFAGRKFAYFAQGEPPNPQGVYRRDSFDEKGDMVSHLCGQNEMPGGFDASTPIRFDPDMVAEDFARRVREYAQAVSEAGAVLWYAPCPMNELAVEDKENMDGFYASLQQTLGIPLAGDPHDFVLNAGWFFGTNFHPNSSGKTVYTRALIRALKAMLGDSSPTDIPLPDLPEWAEAEGWTGDDKDGTYFTYAEQNGTLTVTGLTNGGARRETLTVPSAWEGMPVETISPGAFRGAENLREITIQPNIHTIPDGVFVGCTALERVVMQSDDPSACRVGQGLLEGTNARAYVPPEALSAYRTDYFWSAYGALILPHMDKNDYVVSGGKSS